METIEEVTVEYEVVPVNEESTLNIPVPSLVLITRKCGPSENLDGLQKNSSWHIVTHISSKKQL